MGSRYDRKRMNVEGDRLSSLSDDLIHKILSFIGTKYVVRTSALSSRWRYTWTSTPSLSFSTKDFHTMSQFTKFVTDVLSNRNNQLEVYYVELAFLGKVSQGYVKRILNYAFSHNVQHLNITCLSGKNMEFPLSLFASKSLKHLTLNGHSYAYCIKALLTWNLPALTALNLHCVTLYNDSMTCLLSNCANLKNLTLNKCRLVGAIVFNICHPGLSSLTLEDGGHDINVITPQLESLIISNCQRIHLISTPNLSSLRYKDDFYCGDDLLQLPTHLIHLEKVDICIHSLHEDKAYTRETVCLLQQLHCVKFLTLNFELVKNLFSSIEIISNRPSPFINLKSLKIYPADVSKPFVSMSTEVKNYLLNGSPGATFTMVSHEEIRAVKKVTSARNLMSELEELLDKWKKYCDTNTGSMKQVEFSAQLKTKNFGDRMVHIMCHWENLNKQFLKGYNNTRRTVILLRKIKRVLKKIPISDQARLQARFSGLRVEAEAIMCNVTNGVKMQCDKKPNHSNVFFHELATSSHPSS